jgi:hypothetical protein
MLCGRRHDCWIKPRLNWKTNPVMTRQITCGSGRINYEWRHENRSRLNLRLKRTRRHTHHSCPNLFSRAISNSRRWSFKCFDSDRQGRGAACLPSSRRSYLENSSGGDQSIGRQQSSHQTHRDEQRCKCEFHTLHRILIDECGQTSITEAPGYKD